MFKKVIFSKTPYLRTNFSSPRTEVKSKREADGVPDDPMG